MNKWRINFWLILVVGIICFIWLLAELAGVSFEVYNRFGLAATPFDGVIQHKVGELMVSIPFVFILALINIWSKERIAVLIKKTRFIMIAGGLLNALAWYSLRETVAADSFLRIWCLVIFVFGLSGSWLLVWTANRTKNETEKPVRKKTAA